MQQDRLEIIRQTKLDLAQWITIGISKCVNPATSVALARYAAAQLEAAAMIPGGKRSGSRPARSLLRDEIQRGNTRASLDCLAVLNAVSRAMLRLLAGSSSLERKEALRDIRTARLIKSELRAARVLFESLSRRAAA